MLQRKINAIISLLTTFFLLFHAISTSLWMISNGSIVVNQSVFPWILTGLTALHAYISIDLAVSSHTQKHTRKYKNYPQMNVATIIQRITGVLMVVFTGLHIGGVTGFLQPPQIIHAILPPLFFLISLAHVAVSTSKAFITLGIGNAKIVKIIDFSIKMLCGTTLIAGVTGFYMTSF